MTEKIKITGASITLLASYKRGLLHRIDVIRGKIDGSVMAKLHMCVPLHPSQCEERQKQWPSLKYELVTDKPPSTYKYYVEHWFIFYYGLNNVEPKFTATDGKAVRGIQQHLEKVSADELEALASWKAILAKWHKLPDFYRNKTDLTYINAKLNEIITQLKDEQSNNKQARRDAADLRRS